MKRALSLVALAVALLVPVLSAQTDMSGEWAISFTTPYGPREFTMYVVQEGARLTGRLTSDAGEFPLRGTINNADFTINWGFPDQDKVIDITFKGKVDGDSLSGTATLGTRGSGPLSGTRTGS